jgi:hypothetical protein
VNSLGKLHDGDTEIRKATRRRKVAVSDDVKIPTIAFYKSVEHCAGAKNPNQVATLFDTAWSTRTSTTREWDTASSGKWKNYARGTHKPQSAFVNDVDAIYPGTKAALERGPHGVPLWDALWKPIHTQMDFLHGLALPLPDVLRPFTLEEDLSFTLAEFAIAVTASVRLELATDIERELWILNAAIICYRYQSDSRAANVLIWYRLLVSCLHMPNTQSALVNLDINAKLAKYIRRKQFQFLERHPDQIEWLIVHACFTDTCNPIRLWLNDPVKFPVWFSIKLANVIFAFAQVINELCKRVTPKFTPDQVWSKIFLTEIRTRHRMVYEYEAPKKALSLIASHILSCLDRDTFPFESTPLDEPAERLTVLERLQRGLSVTAEEIHNQISPFENLPACQTDA